jgi:anti-sigma-K factor RskA
VEGKENNETRQGADAGKEGARGARARREPTWGSAVAMSAATAAVVVALLTLISDMAISQALVFAVVLFAVGIPINYYTDRFLYRRRLATGGAEGEKKR